MAVVAVINRKGGSGKSTLATHLAGHCANAGAAVMLGDVDRQLSTQTWLRQRKTRKLGEAREIIGWTIDPKSFVRPPAGIEHVIVDTPGGLHGFDLARVVMYADAILIPVCNSIFDRESASRMSGRTAHAAARRDGPLQAGHSRHAARRSHQVGRGLAGLGSELECSFHCRAARSTGLCPLHRERTFSFRYAGSAGPVRPRTMGADPGLAAPDHAAGTARG